MFGKAKRRDAEAMESIREQLAAADMHARSVLSAVAQTESRWSKDREDRSRSQVSAERAIENVRSSVVESAADVAATLQQVTEMCALVVDRLEADTVERRTLTEAITVLSRQQQAVQQSAPVDTPSRIHGGTVLSSPAAPSNGDATNGSSNGGGSNGASSNGVGSNGGTHNGDIDLTAYEATERTAWNTPASVEEPRTIERFRPFATPPVATSDPVQVLEPEVIDVVEAPPVAYAPPVEAPTPEPAPPVAYAPQAAAAPEPTSYVAQATAAYGTPDPVVSPVPPAEPVIPAKPFDAFAGLPLLAPKPSTPPVEAVRPVEDVVAAAPFAAAPTPPVSPTPFAAVVPPAAPEPPAVVVSDGLEQQWSASYQLTENNTNRPHGGTRLTPRRSNVRATG